MEWISVNDRLPEDDTWILLYSVNNNPLWSVYKLGCYQNDKFYAKEGIDNNEEIISHWLHLPNPPKQ